jgi:hypothetical protein
MTNPQQRKPKRDEAMREPGKRKLNQMMRPHRNDSGSGRQGLARWGTRQAKKPPPEKLTLWQPSLI